MMMHLIGKTAWRMRGWLRRGHVKTALMSCDDTEMRYVRTGAIPVLGGALWWSPGPETTAMQRTWKETLG